MQNKSLQEGVITNQPKLSKYDSVMFFLKQSFKKHDGSEGSRRFRCDAKGAIAQDIANNYKQNQLVQVTGMITDVKAKKKNDEGEWVELVDQFGDNVWEKVINVNAIKKLGEAAMTKPIEQRMGYTASTPAKGPVHATPPLPKQPTPIFKNNANMVQPQAYKRNPIIENEFTDDVPF
jgi:hypothetical protein